MPYTALSSQLHAIAAPPTGDQAGAPTPLQMLTAIARTAIQHPGRFDAIGEVTCKLLVQQPDCAGAWVIVPGPGSSLHPVASAATSPAVDSAAQSDPAWGAAVRAALSSEQPFQRSPGNQGLHQYLALPLALDAVPKAAFLVMMSAGQIDSKFTSFLLSVGSVLSDAWGQSPMAGPGEAPPTTGAAPALDDVGSGLTLLANHIAGAFWLYDNIKIRSVWVSPAYEQIFAVAREAVTADPFAFLHNVHADDLPLVQNALREQEQGMPTEIEYRVVDAGGAMHWIWDRSFPIRDGEGRPTFVAGFATDMTSWHETTDALRISEARLKLALEASAAGVWEWDLDSGTVYWSDEAYRMMGLEPRSAPPGATLFYAALHPDDRERVLAKRNWTVESPSRDLVDEMRVIWPDGSIHWLQDIGRILIDPETGRRRMLGLMVDISRFKEAEAALEGERAKLAGEVARQTGQLRTAYADLTANEETLRRLSHFQSKLLDNAGAAITFIERDGMIISFNRAAERLFGYGSEEVVGQMDISRLLAPDELALVAEEINARHGFHATPGVDLFDHICKIANPFEREWACRRKDGGIIHLLVSMIAIYDEPGELLGLLASASDITERKRIEENLRHSEETLRVANSELERTVRLKDDFLATMSHELRTPLNAILGMSQLLSDETAGPLNERQHRYTRSVFESGEHLLQLINDILDLSKMERSHVELIIEPVSVDDVCRGSMNLVEGLANRKQIQTAITIQPGLHVVQADGRRLKQILVNLLSNAVKFTPDGGQVGLEVTAERHTVQFVVWDTGIGISEDDLPRLFQSFIQLDSSLARRHAGTGLGLALVKRLAELHGGNVVVQSHPGQGSRFIVKLPMRHSAPVS